MKKKTTKKTKKEVKEEQIIKEEVEVKITDVGEVLEVTADENNPIGDGLEFVGGEEHE